MAVVAVKQSPDNEAPMATGRREFCHMAVVAVKQSPDNEVPMASGRRQYREMAVVAVKQSPDEVEWTRNVTAQTQKPILVFL